MEVAYEAARRGIISREDVERVAPQQVWALKVIIEMMDAEHLHDHSVCEFDMRMYSQEVEELGDMLDLEGCDRVEPGKAFEHEEVSVNIPDFLVPFMRGVVLPAIREVLTGGIDK